MTKREHLTCCLISAGKLIQDLNAAIDAERASDYGDFFAFKLMKRQVNTVAESITRMAALIDDAAKEVEAGR